MTVWAFFLFACLLLLWLYAAIMAYIYVVLAFHPKGRDIDKINVHNVTTEIQPLLEWSTAAAEQ